MGGVDDGITSAPGRAGHLAQGKKNVASGPSRRKCRVNESTRDGTHIHASPASSSLDESIPRLVPAPRAAAVAFGPLRALGGAASAHERHTAPPL